MTWTKLNDNLYSHDVAPFMLEKIEGIWGVRDTRDKTQFIPFSDIFNNPVFSIDFTNSDLIVKSLTSSGLISGNSLESSNNVTGINLTASSVVSGNHIRGESANTPSTPAHSFKTEISSGLYRESAGVLAFAILGNKVLEINSKPSYLCKAWISFDGSGATPTPSGSGNISSITKNGTGDYTISFLTAMQDVNYSIYMASKQNGANLGSFGYPHTKLTDSLRFIFQNNEIPTPQNRDQSEVSLGIFR